MSSMLHEGHRLPGPHDAGNANRFSIHTALIALRCWWHIAAPLGILLAAGAAVVVYYTTTPTYTGSAWVLIRARAPIIIRDLGRDDSQRFVQNQIELMRSPPVLDPVASDPAVASTPELAAEVDPVVYLRNKLRIRSMGQSDYFVIEFSSQIPEKAALIVNKVAQEYLSLQDRHEKKINNRTIELLQVQHQAQQQEVKRLRGVLEQLSKQIYGKEAFPIQRTEEKTPARNPLADMHAQLIAAQVEMISIEASIQAEQELFQKESFEPSQAEIETYIDAMDMVREIRTRIQANEAKLAMHREKSVNLKTNDLYQGLDKQVRNDKAALEKTLAELRPEVKAGMEKAARVKRQGKIDELQAEKRRLEVTIQFLTEKTKTERGELQQVAGDTLQFEFARADYDRANKFQEAISERILTMQTEQRAPERVEIFRTANVPTRPDEAMPFKKMGMAGGAAFCLPFALAVGIEILFRRVSSRYQLEQTNQIPVVAEVTSLPARIKSRREGNEATNRDLQLFEESVDGLRTYLALVNSMRGRKVLAVTSAVSREGKTSLSAQLAVSIAGATNRPTLLIDGDMRSPDVHRIFDVERGPGLAEVLKGECPIEEALETGFSETLHLLTAGTLDVSPHRLLGNASFAELIAKLRDMYDCIIVDTPPILPASEALVMASTADAAILCVRRDFSRVDQVADAHARLKAAGVNTAGAVLNGIPSRNYSYRYGSYYYNRHRYPDAARSSPSTEQSAS